MNLFRPIHSIKKRTRTIRLHSVDRDVIQPDNPDVLIIISKFRSALHSFA